MTVYSDYYLVDWEKLTEGWAAAQEGRGFVAEAIEEDAEWLERADFGGDVDEVYYASWRILIEISDWLHDTKERFQQAEVLFSILQDLGLVTRDGAFQPIQRLTDEDDEWILGAMPPEDVEALQEKIKTLRMATLKMDTNAAMAEKSCEAFTGMNKLVGFVRGVHHMLDHAEEKERGLLIVAA